MFAQYISISICFNHYDNMDTLPIQLLYCYCEEWEARKWNWIKRCLIMLLMYLYIHIFIVICNIHYMQAIFCVINIFWRFSLRVYGYSIVLTWLEVQPMRMKRKTNDSAGSSYRKHDLYCFKVGLVGNEVNHISREDTF